MTIMNSDEGVILWQDISLGLPSAGWKSYYITVVDGSPYLIEYHPPEERQGLYYYSCKVFTIDSNGNEIIHAEISGDSKETVDAFNTEIAEYMDNAYPFISTLNENIMTSRIILSGE